jgi:hypothetical protein
VPHLLPAAMPGQEALCSTGCCYCFFRRFAEAANAAEAKLVLS